jgi:hypothetical protein
MVRCRYSFEIFWSFLGSRLLAFFVGIIALVFFVCSDVHDHFIWLIVLISCRRHAMGRSIVLLAGISYPLGIWKLYPFGPPGPGFEMAIFPVYPWVVFL